jgi:hypothetical protein
MKEREILTIISELETLDSFVATIGLRERIENIIKTNDQEQANNIVNTIIEQANDNIDMAIEIWSQKVIDKCFGN